MILSLLLCFSILVGNGFVTCVQKLGVIIFILFFVLIFWFLEVIKEKIEKRDATPIKFN
jgi:hypothetical protein